MHEPILKAFHRHWSFCLLLFFLRLLLSFQSNNFCLLPYFPYLLYGVCLLTDNADGRGSINRHQHHDKLCFIMTDNFFLSTYLSCSIITPPVSICQTWSP